VLCCVRCVGSHRDPVRRVSPPQKSAAAAAAGRVLPQNGNFPFWGAAAKPPSRQQKVPVGWD
jgi:hypothetical protein